MTGYEQIREVFACICGIDRIDTDCMSTAVFVMMLNWIQLKVLKGAGHPFFEVWSHQGLRAKRWERCELVTLADSTIKWDQLISTDHWRRACPHVRMYPLCSFFSGLFCELFIQFLKSLVQGPMKIRTSWTSLADSGIPQVDSLSSRVPVLAMRSAWRSLPMSLQRDKGRRQWHAVTQSDQ